MKHLNYFILLFIVGCSNPQGNVSTADPGFHPGVLGAVISSVECPSSGNGSLNLSLGALNINGAPATGCSVTSINPSLQGSPVCTCSGSTCNITGLTLTPAFLTSMTPGVNSTISGALDYSITSSAGMSTATTALVVTPSTWSPTCLGPNLTMWLDASNTSTLFNDSAGTIPITNGAGVGLWTDLSGNGYNATAVTKPIYNGANKALSFNGTSQMMTSSMTAAVFNGTSGTMFAMLSPGGPNVQYAAIFNFRFGLGNSTGLIYTNTTTYGWDWGASLAYTWNSGLIPSIGQFGVLGFVNSAAGAVLSLNGTTNSTAAYAGFTSNVNGAIPLIIGDDTGVAGRFYFGQMAEGLISTTNVSVAVRQQIEGYLAWKWGAQALLPIAHPYFAAAP